MHTWINQMPQGMHLKSEGFASTLYDPDSKFTLKKFCQSNDIPYADVGMPVRLGTFISYGQEFQRRLVPLLEDKTVIGLEIANAGFQITLDSGEVFLARRVVVAAGISHFQYVPPILRGFSSDFVTHSSQHQCLDGFQGRNVVVVGSGASALDVAALLNKSGATPRVIARKSVIHFHNPPGPLPRPFFDRLRAPMTGLGPGWRSLLCVKAPLVFHRMPREFRLRVVRRHLGPAPAWFIKDAVVGQVELNLGSSIHEVRVEKGRIHLHLSAENGHSRWIETDHVIAGTGYQVDLSRLAFLNSDLRSAIRCVSKAPVLSPSFESSVEGLYFVGAAAAPSFGPLLRFAYGAKFTASHLSRHLVKMSGVRSGAREQNHTSPNEAANA